MNNKINNAKDFGIKILAVVGLLAILGLAIFSLSFAVRLLPAAWSAAAVTLSSIFRPALTLEVSASPINVSNEQPFTLRFELSRKEVGTYSISYDCADGVSLELSNESGKQALSCNTPLVADESTSFIVIPRSSKNRYADVKINVSFKRDGGDEEVVSRSVTATITNESLSTSPGTINGTVNGTTQPNANTNTVSPSTNNTGSSNTGNASSITTIRPGTPTTVNYTVPGNQAPISNPNGKPDFKPTILAYGIIDPVSKIFVATTTLKRSDTIAVKFEIENKGNKTSPAWVFSAPLPTSPMHTFISESQPALNPGDKIEYTLGFDKSLDGEREFTVKVDAAGSIEESDETNNNVSVKFNIL